MIHIEGLWAGYGGLDILRGVDLTVEQATINCIVGPNGAGKSTVLKTISGILAPRAARSPSMALNWVANRPARSFVRGSCKFHSGMGSSRN